MVVEVLLGWPNRGVPVFGAGAWPKIELAVVVGEGAAATGEWPKEETVPVDPAGADVTGVLVGPDVEADVTNTGV